MASTPIKATKTNEPTKPSGSETPHAPEPRKPSGSETQPAPRSLDSAPSEPAPRKPPPPPPPPDLPRAPKRPKIAIAPEAAAPEPAASKWRDLPIDPIEREKARKTVSAEAGTILAILSGIAEAAPPNRPLASYERDMIEVPLQETLYKYGANLDPLVTLAISLATVAFIRWQEVKAAEVAKPKIVAPEPAPPKIVGG
jgi:hypothetical protein